MPFTHFPRPDLKSLPATARTKYSLNLHGTERRALLGLSAFVATEGRAVTATDLIRAALRAAKGNPAFLRAYDEVLTEKLAVRAAKNALTRAASARSHR